jgi:integrase
MSTTNQISTDREIASLKPGMKRYEVSIAGARGLSIRVIPNGERIFEFRYVAANGKRRRMQLGLYPALRLAEAKTRAIQLRSAVIDGDDPSEERAEAKTSLRTAQTLNELATEYYEAAAKGLHGGRKRPKRQQTLRHEKGLFDRYVAKKLGKELFVQISRPDIKVFMRDLAADSGLSAGSVARVGETLSSIFGFAVHDDRLEANPVAGLSHPLALESRERRFDDIALKTLWTTFTVHSTAREESAPNLADPISRLEPVTCLAARFIMVTLCRRNEACVARWLEIDRVSKTWTIPRERAKSGRTEVKPLSAEALAILNAAEADALRVHHDKSSEFVFPSLRDCKRPLEDARVTRAIERLCRRFGLPHGSPHDFRRSGATTLTDERYGFTRFVVSKVLGHSGRDGAAVTAIYDRNEYLPQKRAALEAWAGHLLSLIEKTSGQVPRSNETSLAAE